MVGPLGTNCYILESGSELAVIDPGGDADIILDKIEEMSGEGECRSQKPEARTQKCRVKFVINTHGHVDHVAADKAVLDATGAKLLIGELDAVMLKRPEASLAMLMGLELEPLTADRVLAEGDEVTVGDVVMRVMHTAGHTPGGICLLGPGFAFTGDTLFVDSIGRVDFPGGSESRMQESLGRLQAVLGRDTMLYPGHNEPGTFGRALLVNPFLGSIWPG